MTNESSFPHLCFIWLNLLSPRRRGRLLSLVLTALFAGSLSANAAEWQWSVPDGEARAYLWIPPTCERVRAVMVANHNMLEQGILEHPTMRKTLSELGIAQVWVVPALDGRFDFNKGAGEHFERVINALAEESGYTELRFAPVIPIGHSACATFPWNFAAWNPARTLAVLSVKGDAPHTNMTGYGGANADWGDRNIDGVPGLMVMGEYEWSDDRITPAFNFVSKHPQTPVAFLADPGNGHYNFSDRLVAFLAMFVRKAAEQRLPVDAPLDAPVTLNPIDPHHGWRVDRWRKDKPLTAPAAPFEKYTGNAQEAFWCFDEEMARATEAHYESARGKKPQLLSVTDPATAIDQGCGEPVSPRFIPLADGITFRLQTAFMKIVPGDSHNTNPARWAGLPVGSPLGHATGGGPITLSRTVGPSVQTGPDTFKFNPGRAEYTRNGRNNDMWIVAVHPGDAEYKNIVQQTVVHAIPNTEGRPQVITFPEIVNQNEGVKTVRLNATSDAQLPVSYYIREGPGEVDGDTLKISPIPPRARFPFKVTVVAWQFGRATGSKVKTATPVERTFSITKSLDPSSGHR